MARQIGVVGQLLELGRKHLRMSSFPVLTQLTSALGEHFGTLGNFSTWSTGRRCNFSSLRELKANVNWLAVVSHIIERDAGLDTVFVGGKISKTECVRDRSLQSR
jgi:hypothetical protein